MGDREANEMKRIILLCLALLLTMGIATAETVRLKVIGNYVPYEDFENYMKEHPDVVIEDYPTDSSIELVEAVLTNTDDADMYFLSPSIGQGYLAMRDRGFLAPIEDEALLNFVNSLEPSLLPGLMHDGQICAIPFDCMLQRAMYYVPQAWNQLGLAEEEIPTSWTEFLNFLAEDWPKLAEEHPEVDIFAGDQQPRNILVRIQEDYYTYHATRGDLSFDTPEFRAIIEAFARVDWDALLEKPPEQRRNGLFLLMPVKMEDLGLKCMPLSFTEGGDDACLRATLPSMAINPKSKNKEAAYDLMRYIVENMSPLAKIQICPSEDTPVIHEENQAIYAQRLEELAAYDRKIAAEQDPAARTALEMERESYYQKEVKYMEDALYLASPEDIANYHALVKGRLICAFNTAISDEEYESLEAKRMQFIEGAIDADAFIGELQRRYIFSLKENG